MMYRVVFSVLWYTSFVIKLEKLTMEAMEVNMKKFFTLMGMFISVNVYAACPNIEDSLSVQVMDKNDVVRVCNDQYISYFSKEWKLPVAVVEKLETSDFKDVSERTNDFRLDPRIDYQYQISPKRYTKTGYDKGHLSASSNTSDVDTVSATYYMTNIVPQNPQLNRGTWKNMESFAKDLRKSNYHARYVISGIMFDDCKVTRRKGLPVPDQMFKVVAHDRISTVFLIDNVKPKSHNIMDYTSTLGTVNSRLCKVKIKFNME